VGEDGIDVGRNIWAVARPIHDGVDGMGRGWNLHLELMMEADPASSALTELNLR